MEGPHVGGGVAILLSAEDDHGAGQLGGGVGVQRPGALARPGSHRPARPHRRPRALGDVPPPEIAARLEVRHAAEHPHRVPVHHRGVLVASGRYGSGTLALGPLRTQQVPRFCV